MNEAIEKAEKIIEMFEDPDASGVFHLSEAGCNIIPRSLRAVIEAAKQENWRTVKIDGYDEYDDFISDGKCQFREEENNGFEFFQKVLTGEPDNTQ